MRGVVNYVTELTKASAKSNEPKRLKTLVISKIAPEAEKRTQACYEPYYQSLTTISAPILKKFVWIASALLRIRGYGLRVGRRPSLGGLTSKATMSFRMNRMAFYTAPYRGLGCSQRGRRSVAGFGAADAIRGEHADGPAYTPWTYIRLQLCLLGRRKA